MLVTHAPSGPLTSAFAARSATAHGSSTSNSNRPFAALFAKAKGGILPIANHSGAAAKPDYAPQNLALVARSLRSLLAGETLETLSLEQLYALVESLVHVSHSGPDLYERVEMEGERAAVEISRKLKNQIRESHRSWLDALATTWTQWCTRIQIVRDVLTTLDSGYVLNIPALDTTHALLLRFFADDVLNDEIIREKAFAAIVEQADAQRKDQGVNSTYPSTHAIILSLFQRLGSYTILQDALLTSTKDFYKSEAAETIPSTIADATAPSVQAYLEHVSTRIAEEERRVQWLLASSSAAKGDFVEAVRKELIGGPSDLLVGSLAILLSQDHLPLRALALLYQHLSSIQSLEPLSAAMHEHIIVTGSAIVTPPSAAEARKVKLPPASDADKEVLRAAAADEEALIDRLLALKQRIDVAINEAFANESMFIHRRTEAFEKIVNSRTGGGKVAELSAKYLDAKLKSGNKSMNDEELERCLNDALTLFRYTHAKDMFEEFYKRHFAKRLLLNRSASSDAEQAMLLKLKEECGAEFTQRLETMLKDITLSEDMMKGYASTSALSNNDDFELYVNVLTQSQWPTYPLVEVRIPPVMAAASERFRTFYGARNAGRRLHWAHSLGTCTVKASFPRCGEKELHVSEFQAIVLLLFNDVASGEKLSYPSIREQTGLDDVELKRTLQSLACGQIPTRVLRKDPQGKEVLETDSFKINDAFKNDRHHIRINQIQMKETKEEQESTESRVLLDRELVLQAAAVRILKARKQLKHNELLQEVVDSIKGRFQVDVGEIKKTFEILIEKEYMERVEGERGVYRYLA